MVERNCSNCGRELSAGKRFCGSCGWSVPANAESASPEPRARFCVRCGAAYVSGKRFCKQCGHAFGEAELTAAREPSAIAQDESAQKEAVSEEGSRQAAQVIVFPPHPEPAALLCTKCGVAYAPGKHFCKQCGQVLGTTVPATVKAPSAAAQSESTTKKTIHGEGSIQVAPVIADPILSEPAERFCVKCGTACVSGKRFCKQCGHAFDEAEPVAASEPSAIEQGESAAQESIARILQSDHANTPSEVLPDPSSKAEPGTDPDESFKRDSQERPNVFSAEDDTHSLFKISGDEHAPPSMRALQADFAALDPDVASSGRYELNDSDAGMFRSFQNSTPAPRRRTLLLVLGTVCVAALLGAVWVVTAYYHGRHRPAEIITQPTSPVAVTRFSADQPSKPAPQTAPETPITPTKPAPPRQEAGGHEVPAHRAAAKPDAANSYPTSTRSRGGNCTLDSNMLSRMLDQADRNREQGNYSDAARQYRSVLNCDPNNARAHNDLELTLLDIQHQ